MKRILLFFCLIGALNGWTQVHLEIIDQDTGRPIEGAAIKVFTEDTTQLLISDARGTAKIIGLEDVFILKVMAFGFETYVDTMPTQESISIQLKQSIQLEDVVVTAQYDQVTASQAIQKINVISAEQIQQSGANNLADVLNYQAGIRLSQDNILGTSMSLEGISGQNVKILIDGVPVIGRLDGDIDLSQINLNNVERIEVVEGPLSVNYGTNALGGTINIITKKEPKESLNININPYYESIGNYNLTGTVGGRIKKTSLQVSGGRNYFDGWSAVDPFFQFPASRLADTNRFKTWKPKEQYFGEARLVTEIKGWNLSPYARYFNEKITNRGLPLEPYEVAAFDDYYHTNRADAGLNIQKKWRKGRLKIIAAYNYFARIKNTFYKDLTTLENTLSESPGAHDTSLFKLANLRGNYSWRANQKWQFQTGIDANYEAAFGARILDQEQFLGDYAVYLTATYEPMADLKIKPGVRYAYNTTYQAPVIPSLNIKWNWKKFILRGSVARGYRAPTLKELYFDFVDINHNIQGSTSLLPEFSWNYAGSITWLKPVRNQDLLKFEYGAFYNDIDNLITLGLVNDNTYSYVNIGEFATVGNKFNISYRSKAIQSSLRFNYVGRYNQISNENQSINRYNWSPEVAATFTWTCWKDRLSINAFYKYNGVLQSYFVNSEEAITLREQSAFSILDVSVSSNWWNKRLNLTVGAKNILNVTSVAVIGQSAGVHSSGGNMNAARGTSIFISAKYNLTYNGKTAQ